VAATALACLPTVAASRRRGDRDHLLPQVTERLRKALTVLEAEPDQHNSDSD
jgi:hypothetical protein